MSIVMVMHQIYHIHRGMNIVKNMIINLMRLENIGPHVAGHIFKAFHEKLHLQFDLELTEMCANNNK